jgi:putative hydrolase of the HAD superfamily
MIKAIFFDFGQTLADSTEGFRAAEKEAQEKIFKNLALTDWPEFLENYRKIRAIFHAESNLSRFSIWQEVYWHYCRDSDKDLLENWEDEYWQQVKTQTRLFPETQTVLQKLYEDYKLALITNTQGQKTTGDHRVSLFPDLEKFFTEIIIAGQGDIPAKPDPAPFKMCLRILNMEPSEVVFIGDDWHKDICGAENAGMKAIWLKHNSVHRKWFDVETDIPIIFSLEELLDLHALKL